MSRVSSDEQAKGYSLDIQSEALENYCHRNDIEIVYSFREDHSAKNFDRPSFKEFLEHLKRNKNAIDLLLFTTWDRFSRNAKDAYHMIDTLKRHGVTANSIEQPIDLTVPENKMLLAMYLVMPEIDNDRRSMKVKEGMRAALKAGRWCRKAPYGYRNSRDENNRPIIVPNEYAEPIREAYRQVAKGTQQSEVLVAFKEKGTPISKSQLSLILRNPVYAGKIQVPALENEPYQIVEGEHEALISDKLFYQVQQALSANNPCDRIPSSVKNDLLPLRGILSCSECGYRLTGSRSRGRRGTRYAYYHCNNCGNERYRAEAVNETLAEVIGGIKLSRSCKVVHEELVKRLLNGDNRDKATKRKKLQAEIDKQEERIQRLQDNLADGILSSEDFVSMKTRFASSKRTAQEQLLSLQEDNSGKEELLHKAVKGVDSLGTVYSNADASTKVKILGSIFPEMIEFDGNKCRTPKINEAVLLCLNADKGFRENKNGKLHDKLDVSRLVARRGIEPLLPG